jgi:hypothetical protein
MRRNGSNRYSLTLGHTLRIPTIPPMNPLRFNSSNGTRLADALKK